VVGAGYIGLEIAAVARALGLEVTVLEMQDRVLARVTAPPMSTYFHELHTEGGVDVRVGVRIEDFEFASSGEVRGVRLHDGTLVDSDLVLVGIGLVPSTELAEAAGLHVEDGIVVDSQLRTADPAVYAIGDVARYPDPTRGMLRRLESVPNATEQARVVAATICGEPASCTSVPWFWSDQYDVKLQVVGWSADYDELVVRRGDGRHLSVFYLSDGRVVSAEVANNPAEFAAAKKLVATGVVVDSAHLSDPQFSLRGLFPRNDTAV